VASGTDTFAAGNESTLLLAEVVKAIEDEIAALDARISQPQPKA